MKETNFCWNIEKIENYDLAKADNFQNWVIHHKLETHDSDGRKRKIELTKNELISLNMYFYRPENELIFLTRSEHRALHNSVDKKGKPSPMKGRKIPFEQKCKISNANKGRVHSEKSRKHISEGMRGMHWFTNGIENHRGFTCPDGFVPGRTFNHKK